LGIVCVLLILGGLLSSASAEETVVAQSTVNLKVYVIAVDGVGGGHEVGNLSRAVAGALQASDVTAVKFHNGQMGTDYYDQPANITTNVVTDWSLYESIVENESNAVLVNAHADILPVPLNYSREAWVGKITEAVANRNMTWVHTGGYPFYYYQPQNGNETLWGQDGFTLFMNSMGIPNATCIATREGDLYPSGDGGIVLESTWGLTGHAFYEEGGYTINASDFQGKLTMAFGGYPYEELVGVVNFAGDKLGTPGCNSGFYVHVGALKTYNSIQDQTDGDFLRSYIGTAAALYNVAWNFALEQKNRNQQSASSLMDMLTAIALFSMLAVAIGVPSYFLYRRRRRGHDK
jgi:hypothetical protein